MSDIIDFEARLNLRDVNPNLTVKDEDGQDWFTYTGSYTFEEKSFVVQIRAKSLKDADARCQAMRESMKIEGLLCEEISHE